MISERVRTLREAKGLTQEDLAKLVGVKQQNIQQLEDGTVKQPRYIRELAVALNTSVDDLLGTSVKTKKTKVTSGVLQSIMDTASPKTKKFLIELKNRMDDGTFTDEDADFMERYLKRIKTG